MAHARNVSFSAYLRDIHSMRGYLLLGLASEMSKYSARRALLWQLIAKN